MMIHVNIVICSVQRVAHDAEVVATAWRILILLQEETDYAWIAAANLRIESSVAQSQNWAVPQLGSRVGD